MAKVPSVPKPPKFRYPVAIVVWDDAHARNQAVEYEESEIIQQHRPEQCQILALVIRDDDRGLTLYTEETGPTSVRGVSFVPRPMIKAVHYVTLTTPARPRKRRDTPVEEVEP